MGPRGGLGGGWNGSRDSFQPLQPRSRKIPEGGDLVDMAVIPVTRSRVTSPFPGMEHDWQFFTVSWMIPWSPDGKALQYKLRVFYEAMPPTFGKSRPTAESQSSFSSGRIFDFTWSADGNQLLLIRVDVVVVSNSL